MALPQVVEVRPGSPAARAGMAVGDTLVSINGEQPRDVIAYQFLVDQPDVELEIDRGGLASSVEITKGAGEPLGVEVQAALFDQVRTCDNHCSFCFIYQLPAGLRRSLYLKDDDYRLSFLYGNFTTLTRFTEADLERVVDERLSPLYVSIHATDPEVRSSLLRNRRGAMSLRWLRALLDHGIEVHGQIVVCPGVNDRDVLEQTLCGVLDEYPELASVAVVPLGVSDHSTEAELRPHTRAEAAAVVTTVESWQATFLAVLGRRLVFAADEYYLLAGRPFPDRETYESFDLHEDGIGMARHFELEFEGLVDDEMIPQAGFFASVDGAPAEGYRAPRLAEAVPARQSGRRTTAVSGANGAGGVDGAGGRGTAGCAPPASGQPQPVVVRPRREAPVGIITSRYGERVLGPVIERYLQADSGPGDGSGSDPVGSDPVGSDPVEAGDRPRVRLIPVDNEFFGGNIAVTGLLVGADIARALAREPSGHRYLLPDVCLSGGRFLDGMTPDELPRSVEVIGTSGVALRATLDRRSAVGGRS